MTSFRNEKRENRGPQQRIRLTDSLVAAIFLRKSEDGRQSVHWSVDRHNPDDESSPFRTLRPRDLLELPVFVQELAEAMAEGNMLPEALRKQLARLSAAMAQVTELMKESFTNGDGEGNPHERRALSFG